MTIHHNPRYNPPSGKKIAETWTKPVDGLYAPVTYSYWGALAFAAELNTADAIGIHLNPRFYHAGSLVLHALSARKASPAELAQIRELLDRLEGGAPARPVGGRLVMAEPGEDAARRVGRGHPEGGAEREPVEREVAEDELRLSGVDPLRLQLRRPLPFFPCE